jgi:hypothetical protein
MFWAKRKDKAYNFRTRKYEKEKVGIDQLGNPYVRNPWTWTGAHWGPDGGRLPQWYRCGHGDFYQFW